MRPLITKITPWHPAKVRIQWDLEEVGEYGTFRFNVERSGSPGGPWTTVVASLADIYTYDDLLNDGESANTLSLVRDIYYRIKATPPSGVQNAVYSPIINLDGLSESALSEEEAGNPERPIPVAQFEPNPQTGQATYPTSADRRRRLIKRSLLRNAYLMLRRLNGIEFVLLKRRHFGARCSCYEPISRVVLQSKCATCYGTSWVGGYFNPISVLGRVVRGASSDIQSGLSQQSKDDLNLVQIQTLDFPKIDEGDLLVARDQNRRFVVKQRFNTSLKSITVHQTLTASELSRVDPAFSIAIDL